jgi:hypothetical protein
MSKKAMSVHLDLTEGTVRFDPPLPKGTALTVNFLNFGGDTEFAEYFDADGEDQKIHLSVVPAPMKQVDAASKDKGEK